ncbi:MAG: hypothetical protein U0Y68_03610 [Blastocatellia bacterium]
MLPKIFRLIGLLCCLAAVVLGVAYFTGRPLWGNVMTPFLMLLAGALLLVRARLTRS